MLGPWLISIGYASAIIGGILLFVNTPPDVGGTHALVLPRSTGAEVQQEGSLISSRRFWNRIGFALMTVGGVLQITGYWFDKFSA